MKANLQWIALGAAMFAAAPGMKINTARADELPTIDRRFAAVDVKETPSHQRHVSPLMGRLGCNGRACHGSFQGRGGFRLSLFGYDFKFDHASLTDAKRPRVNTKQPLESLILAKPTSDDDHEGGERYAKGGWEYNVLRRWIEEGAKSEAVERLQRLEITPSEILFAKAGDTVQLQAVAVWADGTREDVTPLCRFRTGNGQIAKINEDGLVTAAEPGDTHVIVSYDRDVVPVPVIRPVSDLTGAKYPQVDTPTRIDELVVEKLKKLGVLPSETADDAEFLRRVSLDITGTLPTPREVEQFLSDKSADKRARKIDALLETPAYAAWWTTKLCDFTGNNDDALNNVVPVRGRASQDWYDWVYRRVADNVPYDQLAEGIVLATSRNKDESYRDYTEAMSKLYHKNPEGSFADRESMPHYWARVNFRQAEERVIGFSYAFLGIRIQCAQCHKHPFDQWSKEDFAQFRGFFTSVGTRGVSPESRKEYDELLKQLKIGNQKGNQARREFANLLAQGKTVPFDEVYAVKPRQPNANRGRRGGNGRPSPAASAKLLGADRVDLTKHDDARAPLMEWLRDKDNPYFARALVNRVWASYFNVGIVEPADDLSLGNPPSNGPLLDYLSRGFIEHGFDMKWLHREIAGSRTYQTSWRPNETNRGDEINFSHAIVRRLPAEVVYDAIGQATASDEAIRTLHEDLSGRAISVAGSSQRNRGRGGAAYALSVFGRSERANNCDCDRSTEPSLLQTVFLQNDRELLAMVDRRDGGWLNQIARQVGEPLTAAARPDDADQRIKAIENQIRRLKKAGQDDRARPLEKRLAELKKRFGADKSAPKPRPSKTDATPMNPDTIVRQAYLRTLSRPPSEREMERSRQYLSSADDLVDGARGLMWALLNTKEFIVNH